VTAAYVLAAGDFGAAVDAAAFLRVFRLFFQAWRIFIRLRWCLLRLRAMSEVPLWA